MTYSPSRNPTLTSGAYSPTRDPVIGALAIRNSVSLPWKNIELITNALSLPWKNITQDQIRAAVNLPWIIRQQVDNVISLGWADRSGASNTIPWADSTGQSIDLPWQTGQDGRAFFAMPYALRTDVEKNIPWLIRSGKTIFANWDNPRGRRYDLNWDLKSRVYRSVELSFAETTNARKSIDLNWQNIIVDRISRSIKLSWGNLTAANVLVLNTAKQLKIIETGEVLQFKSCTLQSDESSWSWRLSLVMSDVVSWQKLKPTSGPIEIELTIRGYTFKMLIEGSGKARSDKQTNYTLNGRSVTARLSKTFADQISKVWLLTTAETITQELCSSHGVTLDWQMVDWPISRHEVDNRYPIDIINSLVQAAGGILQTTPNGTLTARPLFLVSPNQHDLVTPDHYISDIDDFYTMSERWESREGYDHIEVGNEAINDEASISLSTSDAGGGAVLVSANVVPFQNIDLNHSGESNVDLFYQGVVTETKTATVEIVDGRGRLPNPFYGLIDSAYRYVDLGALTINESGDVTTAIPLHSIVDITYTTKYHTWRATSLKDQAQVYVEDL